MPSNLSRRRFLALAGLGLVSTILDHALGQGATAAASPAQLRIGAVLPTTGDPTLGALSDALLGRLANDGAIMADDEVRGMPGPGGRPLKALISSAPDAEAAVRAAERMVREEEAFAILGGFSSDEAEGLSELASQHDVLYLNIGAQSDDLRGASCSSHTFHLAASETMYLDALVGWASHQGFERPFFVYDDSAAQRARYASADHILKLHHSAGAVGSAQVQANTPLYSQVFDDARKADADLIVLLLEPAEQLVFYGQYEDSGADTDVIGYPSPVAQTRAFYAAVLTSAPNLGAKHHIATWEANLDTNSAPRLNQRYLGRFGQAIDPPAWAAYMGIKLLVAAAAGAGSTKASQMIAFMQSRMATFDIGKGEGTSFRPWNHQMRQPLYLVRTNAGYQDKTSLQDLVTLDGTLPELYLDGVPPEEALDRLGVSEEASTCVLAPEGT